MQVFLFVFFFFNVYLFSRRRGAREREREKERERFPSRLCAVGSEPDTGLDLMNHEITT